MINRSPKYFLEVAHSGSLSAASAISRQISRLEEEVGASLFKQASRGMTLTEAGQLLLAHARRTSLETDATLRAIASLQGTPGHVIRLSCSQGLANELIPTAVAQSRKKYPETRFQLWVGQSQIATEGVAEGEADLAITFSVRPGARDRRAPCHAIARTSSDGVFSPFGWTE